MFDCKMGHSHDQQPATALRSGRSDATGPTNHACLGTWATSAAWPELRKAVGWCQGLSNFTRVYIIRQLGNHLLLGDRTSFHGISHL